MRLFPCVFAVALSETEKRKLSFNDKDLTNIKLDVILTYFQNQKTLFTGRVISQ